MRATPLVLLLAAALIFSGCLGARDSDDAPPVRPVMPEDPMPHGGDHDHTDPAQHQFMWNYELAHHDPMHTDPARLAGLHAMHRVGDWLFGAVWGSRDASVDGGLVIWDISDPARPVETGRFTIPGSVGGDRSVGATVDGDYVVLGLEYMTCFGQVNPLGAAISAILFDVRDKSNPVPADMVFGARGSLGSPDRVSTNLPGRYHTVTVDRIGDDDIAWLWGDLYRIDRSGGDARLMYLTSMTPGHDMYIRHAPDGTVWGLWASGAQPFVLFDLSDPAAPQRMGEWEMEDRPPTRGDAVTWYFHSADAYFFDDQTLIVLVSEDVGDHVSPFFILDATDPYDLRHIGTWTNPGEVPAQHILFSQHNQRFHDDGLLTLTHYHGGFLQFDFREPSWRSDPPVIAYGAVGMPTAMVHDPSQVLVRAARCETDRPGPAPGIAVPESPLYVDVQVGVDGILYIADPHAGLFVFKPTADHPVYGHLWQGGGHGH